jgi:photosystem II stability/assembly factor-like uncharacterized protein
VSRRRASRPGRPPGRPLPRLAVAACCALALAAFAWTVLSSSGTRADAAASTSVTIQVPATAGGCLPGCLRGTVVQLSASVTPADGTSIVSVAFERSPAGAETWTQIGTADRTAPYAVVFNSRLPATPDGLYDFRAVAVESSGNTAISQPARDRLVANFFRPALLADPGSPLNGTVTLTATTADSLLDVEFQRSPEGADVWTTFATDASAEGTNPPRYSVQLDTRELPDGRYDLRAIPTGWSLGVPWRARHVDNTAPTAALAPPGGPLSGVVTLEATADDAGTGTGVGGVRFERAPAGSGTWAPIGTRTRAPFAQRFDTRGLADGRYDLRAVATDRAGNTTVSAAVRDVAVANPGQPPAPRLAVEHLAAPADNVRLLGAVAGSSEHETWGYGVSSAAPATVDGERLPYTSPGEQLVLLRYTDAGGWQIADVLRNADGSAFELLRPGDQNPPSLRGHMTPSGEAWLALSQGSQSSPNVELFHRAPGGRFVHDPAASADLRTLTSHGVAELRLGQNEDGSAYGVLVAPAQDPRLIEVPQPAGPPVLVSARLEFGVLADGRWTRRTAALPEGQELLELDEVTLTAVDLTASGAGWGALSVERQSGGPRPLILGRFQGDDWSFAPTGMDALDLTDAFADADMRVNPTGLRADGDAVWIEARVEALGSPSSLVIARYDGAGDEVTHSWCQPLPRRSLGCAAALGLAVLPDAIFDTPHGSVAVALPQPARSRGFFHIYRHGDWARVPAPGYGTGALESGPGRALFTSPGEGWLAGPNAIGRITATPAGDSLALWPQSNRAPLTSVAVPPGSDARVDAAGALAVGLGGNTLRYDAAAGWLVEPVPDRARRLHLNGVAFAGPSRAFAVGQVGTILRWDGTAWSEDPQSVQLTQTELTAVAFGQDGEGWAVGRFGTILHFDGSSWSEEQPPPEDQGLHFTSVAVAGSDVFGVIGGNLVQRGSDGTWRRVPPSLLPDDPAPAAGELRLVAGLPDGGVVAAGRSVVLVRERAGRPFAHSPQPLEGIAVALAAFRPPGGSVRAFASVAPPALQLRDVAGYPPGDGELLRQTATGWEDLSRAQYAGSSGAPTDGVVKADPVLAIAPSPSGERAWVVGGFAGTLTAAGFGTDAPLPSRPSNWYTSSIWRYDAGGSARSPAVTPATVSIPAQPGVVSFAFFSSAICKTECGGTIDAQPDVNLLAASRQIAAFAEQPGGPAFAVFGGNARNRSPSDFSYLPSLFAPLGDVPLFAAYGPHDAAVDVDDPTQPWADAFARAPAPFGPSDPPPGITPVGSGLPAGAVNRYYAFDASQNGGRMRVVVIDNSAGTLEETAPGQTDWLRATLVDAVEKSLPTVVIAPRALRPGGAEDGDQVAAMLAGLGVRAVFTPHAANFPAPQLNERRMIPAGAVSGEPQIPQYEGASMGYQETANNGVLWYSVAVDTNLGQVQVQAIPVVESLALRPLLGLTVDRSSTLAFDAVGRRPVGTLPETSGSVTSGIDNYVGIPAPSCGSRPCMTPSYFFTSSDPTIGDFVVPSGPGSRFPRLDTFGRTTASMTSGLFCAYNTGTTTVSVTSGLLRASLPVTVRPGDIGRPCGTVFREGVGRVVVVPRQNTVRQSPQPGGATAPPPPPPAAAPVATELPEFAPPPPPAPGAPPADAPPAPRARPLPPVPSVPPPVEPPLPPNPPPAQVPAAPVIAVPPVPPSVQPIPPGGASTAQAAARRREKVKQHAQQSAYTTRPAGASATDWFYPAVGVVSVLALLLVAGGVRAGPGPRPRPALLTLRGAGATRSRGGAHRAAPAATRSRGARRRRPQRGAW